jgi:YVTN family beta-propeller protein
MKRSKYLALVTIGILSAAMAFAQTVVATIPVGSAPSLVAVNRKSNLIYVTNAGSNSVSVIDGSNNTVVATDPVGSFPQAVVTNPGLNRIYVGVFGSTDQLSVINGATNQVKQFQIGKSGVATGMTASPQTGSVYICNPASNVVVFNGKTNKIATKISVPNCGFGMNVIAKTKLVYVATFTPNITVIDGATNKVVDTLPLNLTGAVAVATDGQSNRLGVVDTNAGEFEVIDAATGDVLGTVTGLQRPFGAVYEPGAKFALVTEESGNDLALIDATNFTVVNRTPVGQFPLGLDYDPLTHFAYVVNMTDATVSVVSIP